MISDFSRMCMGGTNSGMGEFMTIYILTAIFSIMQLFGFIVMIVGVVDLMSKKRGDESIVLKATYKFIAGILLINYKEVLRLFGVV